MIKKTVFFDVDQTQRKLIEEQFSGISEYELSFTDKQLDRETAEEFRDMQAAALFIRSKVTEDILGSLPDLKIISTLSTGYDHIDLETCSKRNITVSNVPDYGDNTVAEYAFGLILALAKKFKPTFERAERGIFSRSGLAGSDLDGKTLGIIGTGKIGSNVVRMGWAFGMKVVGYDPQQNLELVDKYNLEYLELEELLRQSDAISLHVPYNSSTHHLLDEESLKLIKPSALIVNTSRGKVIDTSAIANALREGRLGGAALDTFEGEEIWLEEEFLRRDDLAAISLKQAMESFFILRSEKVILTPHNAFNTKEAMDRILITGSENIINFFEGKPQNVVNDYTE